MAGNRNRNRNRNQVQGPKATSHWAQGHALATAAAAAAAESWSRESPLFAVVTVDQINCKFRALRVLFCDTNPLLYSARYCYSNSLGTDVLASILI